ncbi:uncharacterized protein PFL1_01527 [Pseudozyma flocculosa PF-1]|uniref:uncharacterized protein n=1 Tax=Pseudozyma flocculosa PF-1 TaxID=1277687 RepID=UPI000456062E|nr:uncharacterized protein PFL1_01527 [Pseudozyma flocculosa PF-1]EPQ31343.1 hypothetical protein PFL1_01527 [Pseudozyma flocculosa PF-1]
MTSDRTAFHDLLPTAFYARLGDDDQERLALLDSCSTIGIIDAQLAQRLGAPTPQGPCVPVNGIGSDTTLGHVTLPFSIAANAKQEAIDIQSSADFHVVRNFGPGLCFGIDVIKSLGIVIDSARGIATTDEGTFPVYDTKGVRHTAARTAKVLRAAQAVTLPPECHVWVPVSQSCKRGLSYTLDSALWCHRPARTMFATTGALVDADTSAILVTNFSRRPHRIPANFILGDAIPLAVGDDAKRASSFHLFAEAQAPDTAGQPYASDEPNAEDQAATNEGNSATHFHAAPTAAPPTAEASEQDQQLDLATAALVDEATTAALSGQPSADPVDPSAEWDPRIAPPPDTSPPNQPKKPPIATVDGHFRVGRPAGSDEPHAAIVEVLRANVDAFSLDGRPGHIRGEEMSIPLLPGETPKPEAPRRVSPWKRKAIDENMLQLEDWDVIEPSNSSASYPILLVKQGAKIRMCVDYRGLNNISTTDSYPLPRIDDVHNALGGHTIFSGLDAIRGYHQLGIKPEDRWKTAFVCHRGLFQYKRVPFGLRNAPAAFQRFMDRLLGGMRWTEALVYLDDVVVFSRTIEEHAASLNRLLKAAIAVGLKFAPEKCTFATSELKLLGRRISAAGVATLEDRTEAVRSLVAPESLQDLYRVLGLLNYYRSFIPNFARRVEPLTSLTRGISYKKDDQGRYFLTDGQGKRVAASSVRIDWGADQAAAFEDLKDALASPPVLAHPDFSKPFILYVDSSKHAFAAALHQRASDPQAAHSHPTDVLSIARLLRDDAAYEAAIDADAAFSGLWRQIRDGADTPAYAIREGRLIRTGTNGLDNQICVPEALLPKVFSAAHDLGHFGFAKSLLSIRESVFHPRLAEGLRSYIRHCPACRRTKPPRAVGALDSARMLSATDRPFHTISVDVASGFPPSADGTDALLVVTDLFSKMILVEPCRSSASTNDLCVLLERAVLRRGWCPSVIVSDSDSRFVGQAFQTFATTIGAELQPSRPYHQQANPVERQIQTLQRVIRSLSLSQPDWIAAAYAAELAINSTPALGTQYAPFDLVYIDSAHDRLNAHLTENDPAVRLLDDRLALARGRLHQARDAIERAQASDKRRYDRRRRPIPKYKVGDPVLILTKSRPVHAAGVNNKIDPPTVGPFTIAEIRSPHRVRLDLPLDMRIDPVLDVSQIAPYPSEDPFGRPLDATPDSFDDDTPLFEIDRIIGERIDRRTGERSFRVRWKNDPRPTWEPERTLREDKCDNAINDWLLRDVSTPPPPEPVAQAHARWTSTDQDERPVAFISKLTSASESRLVGLELEITGLAWAVQRLQHYLEGASSIEVITDHAPLRAVLAAPLHSQRPSSARIEKMRAYLTPFLPFMTVRYKPGSQHTNADALSRLARLPS